MGKDKDTMPNGHRNGNGLAGKLAIQSIIGVVILFVSIFTYSFHKLERLAERIAENDVQSALIQQELKNINIKLDKMELSDREIHKDIEKLNNSVINCHSIREQFEKK